MQQRRRGLGRLDQRVADAVLQLARQQAAADAPGASLIVQATQSDLAAMLSVSRQTVNKELARLAQGDLLRVNYGCLTLLDVPALRRLAEDATAGA